MHWMRTATAESCISRHALNDFVSAVMGWLQKSKLDAEDVFPLNWLCFASLRRHTNRSLCSLLKDAVLMVALIHWFLSHILWRLDTSHAGVFGYHWATDQFKRAWCIYKGVQCATLENAPGPPSIEQPMTPWPSFQAQQRVSSKTLVAPRGTQRTRTLKLGMVNGSYDGWTQQVDMFWKMFLLSQPVILKGSMKVQCYISRVYHIIISMGWSVWWSLVVILLSQKSLRLQALTGPWF